MSYMTQVLIKFSDLDVFGHVNHARFLTYCEDSRTEFLAELGDETGNHLLRTGFVIAHVDCDYLAPLNLQDRVVSVVCSVLGLGRSSVTLGYLLRSPTRLVARVRSVLVLTGDDGETRRISDQERAFFARYQVADMDRWAAADIRSGR